MTAARPPLSPFTRAGLLVLILTAEFFAIEAGLRLYGGSEGSTTFQSMFVDDPFVGHRLRPGARIHYASDR